MFGCRSKNFTTGRGWIVTRAIATLAAFSFYIVFAMLVTGCDRSASDIVRVDSKIARTQEIAREVRRVVPSDIDFVLDLSEHIGCHLMLAAAPSNSAGFTFTAIFLDENEQIVRELSLRDTQTVEYLPAQRLYEPPVEGTEFIDTGWIEETVKISDSRMARLELRAPGKNGIWAEPMLVCDRPTDARKPNVLLISLDTLRADRLATYGGGTDLTPNLDHFARGSAVFGNVFSAFPNTLGSHASLFTAYYPDQHGLMVDSDERLSETAPTLAAHFAENGYTCAAFTENAFVSSDLGFNVGFDRYHNGPEGEGRADFPGVVNQTFARGRAWLRSRPAAPFFLFLHTYEVHTPYTPTYHARAQRLKADGVSYEGAFSDSFGGLGEIVFNRRKREFSQKELDQIERLYDAEVSILDVAVGRLLAEVRQMGLLGDTIVVLFSDHGEEFNEHGYLGHGETLHTQVLHVPLIIRTPRWLARPGRFDTVASLIDVGPTLAGLAGLPRFAPDSPGQDLSGWIRGEVSPLARPVFSRLNKSDASCGDQLQGRLDHCPHDGLSVRDGSYSYIRSKVFGWERLYDMQADPSEQRDLSSARSEILVKYRGIADRYTEFAGAIALSAEKADLDSSTSNKLRALGYID